MIKTREKVNAILDEIGCNLGELKNSLTTAEVVNILLEKDNNILTKSTNISDNTEHHYIFDMSELGKWTKQNNYIYQIDYYRNFPLDSRKTIKIINFFKKIIRKLVRFIIEPICKDQTMFNASVTASINALYNNEVVTQSFLSQHEDLLNDINILKEEILTLKSKLNNEKEYTRQIKSSLDRVIEFPIEMQRYREEFSFSISESQKALQDNMYSICEKKERNLRDVIREISDEFKAKLSDKESEAHLELYQVREEVEARINDKESEVHSEITNIHEELETKYNALELEAQSKLVDIREEFEEKLVKSNCQLEQKLSDIQTQLEMAVSKRVDQAFNNCERNINSVEINFLKALRQLDTPHVSHALSFNGEAEQPTTITSATNTYEDIDYFDFENYFRGSQSNIKNNQKIYVPYFMNSGMVVDLGSGRGEFLELLKEHNIPAVGIDTYEEFVQYCNIKGLHAIKDDALHYLEGLEDESVGGIFASQLVEHLAVKDIINLCMTGYSKLKPGSHIVIETPNPTNLAIYTNWFYVDPSHIKPVHPKMMEYFLSKAGFQNIDIIFTETSKIDYRLPLLNGINIENLEDFNDGINFLSDILFGSQDYAIVARK